MVLRLGMLLFFALTTLWSSAQFYPKKQDFRTGITFGLTPSTVLGSELENPTMKTGVQSGIYYRKKVSETGHVEINLGAALRGSKFDHSKDDSYNRLNFVVMEMPLLYLLDIMKKEEKMFIVAGLSPMAILQTEFYVVPELTARDELRNVGIKRFDLAAVLGYHISTYYTGLRITAQYGILDLNDNLLLQGVTPETGNGGNIQSFALNLQIYF